MNFHLVGAVLAGSVLGSLGAQVATVGGVSPDYLDLPQAVAAVAPGSILIVRPGKYTGFTTGKPLRIHLDFPAVGGSIAPASGAAYAITISGMPAGGTFSLTGDGAEVKAGALGAIRIANTAGRVVVEGVTVAAGAAAAIDVQNAGPVLLHDCDLAGTPGVLVQTATVVANDLRVSSPGGNALVAYHGTLDVAGGRFSGRDLPALSLVDSGIRLAGDGGTPIKVSSTSPIPVPAFTAVNSQVQWDPTRFVLVPANGAAAFQGGGTTTVIAEDPPLLTARGGAPGANGWIRFSGNGALPGAVLFGPFAAPTFTGLSGLYLDLAQASIVFGGIVDPAGLSVSFQMPTATALLGDVSCLQGAVLPPSGQFVLSGPVPLVTL
ncbi:MAG: hypothetical protein JNM25_07540 [Planctomycetes bacterium]|nr:hypothetical protein [Planctomycetota bacterium]